MRAHWREYVGEAAGLGMFMLIACVLGTLLAHPASPVVHAIPAGFVRRMLMGLAMGLTAVALIYSPWGRRSGAHFNPATTLTFWRLGKVRNIDAAAYAIAQALGGATGVAMAAVIVGPALGHPAIRYVTTVPGSAGALLAFVAEMAITFLLMIVVLQVSNTRSLERFTGVVAGALVALYITVEAPLSGMSMNPARSLVSAVPAGTVDALWIYIIAPPLGMLIAAELYARQRGAHAVYCAKLNHPQAGPCIFRCRHADLVGR
jgi:aquaporin Z